jgi:hypothetical protein
VWKNESGVIKKFGEAMRGLSQATYLYVTEKEGNHSELEEPMVPLLTICGS